MLLKVVVVVVPDVLVVGALFVAALFVAVPTVAALGEDSALVTVVVAGSEQFGPDIVELTELEELLVTGPEAT